MAPPTTPAEGGGSGCIGVIFWLALFVSISFGSNFCADHSTTDLAPTPPPQIASVSVVSSPSPSPTPPVKRVWAPRFVAFRGSHSAESETSAISPSRDYSVVFAYDRVKIIPVAARSEIPQEHLDRATSYHGRGEDFTSVTESDTFHVFEGVADIITGDLYGADELSVRIATWGQEVRDLTLVLSQKPRGPPALLLESDTDAVPSALRGLIHGTGNRKVKAVSDWPRAKKPTPLRMIYVVGRVQNFNGPTLYARSVLNAEIIDLAPRKTDARGVLVEPSQVEFAMLDRLNPEKVAPEVWELARARGTYVGDRESESSRETEGRGASSFGHPWEAAKSREASRGYGHYTKGGWRPPEPVPRRPARPARPARP